MRKYVAVLAFTGFSMAGPDTFTLDAPLAGAAAVGTAGAAVTGASS